MEIPTCTHVLERLPIYAETGQCVDWATKLIARKYGEILFLLLVYLFNIGRDKLHRVIPALLSEFLLRSLPLRRQRLPPAHKERTRPECRRIPP